MTRLRSCTFARRATADTSSFGEARSATQVHHGIVRVFATAALVLIGATSTVFACPVCFGAEETSMVDGTKLGILVMLGITFAVQGGFAGFFLYLRKRARRSAELELDTEWSKLQRR